MTAAHHEDPEEHPDLSVVDGGHLAPEVQVAALVDPSPFATAWSWLKRPRVRRSVFQTVSVIVVIFFIEYVAIPRFAQEHVSITLLERVNFVLLVLGVIAEAGALAAYAQLTHSVLQPNAPGRWRLLRINLSSFALSHVLPAGTAPGGALSYRLLSAEGVPGATAGLGLAIQSVGSAVVLNLIFWVALIFSIPLNGFNPLYGFAALAGAFLLAAFAATLVLLSRGDRHADGWLRRAASKIPYLDPDVVSRLTMEVAERIKVLLSDRHVLRQAMTWAALNWLLDAASLWIFLWAFGRAVNPIDLLVAYGLANILAVIPLTPGGIGVIEFVLISTLVGFHVPKDVATFGVLSYRLVNFWLPIPVGGASYLSLRLPRRRRSPATSSSLR